MRLLFLIVGSVGAWVLGQGGSLYGAPGDVEWQTVKSVIQEKVGKGDPSLHAVRMQRFETAYAAALAANPESPMRWEALFFHTMDALMSPDPTQRLPPEVTEKHFANLRELLQAPDATAETKALSSGLLVMKAPTINSEESARAWATLAEKHLATYPAPAVTPTDTTFDPELHGMMNYLIQRKLTPVNKKLQGGEAPKGEAGR